MSRHSLTLVVGLGNTGAHYAKTRHNVGIMCLKSLANKYNVDFKTKLSLGGHVAEVRAANTILFWPETFMNISGKNVKAAVKQYRIDKTKLVVLHDCLETKLGVVKVKNSGSLKGHNGLKSIS